MPESAESAELDATEPGSTLPDDANQHDAAPAGDSSDDAPTRADEGREAARYRRQLREVEAERDALREQLTAHQRQAAERLVAGRLADPRDLWLAGVELLALLDQDGAIDAAKVDAAVADVLADRPHWGPVRPAFNGGPRKTPEPESPGWADLLRGKR